MKIFTRVIFLCIVSLGGVAHASHPIDSLFAKRDSLVLGENVMISRSTQNNKPLNFKIYTKTADEAPRKLFDLEFSGYARFNTYYRAMDQNYAGDPKRVLYFGGWANMTQINQLNPLVYLSAKVRPTSNSFIEVDYTFNDQFTGQRGDSSRYINAFRLMRAQAGINTKYFNLRLGTAGAYGFPVILSPLTSGYLQFKMSSFYRMPWDWYRSPVTKYNDAFSNQSIGINQMYSGVGGVQGVSAEFSNLPYNIGLNFMYGVFNQTNSATIGNTGAYQLGSAKTSFGFRLYKKFGDNNQIGLNWFQNNGPINSTSNKTEYQTIRTIDAHINTDWFTFNPEVGIGWYVNPLGKWQGTDSIQNTPQPTGYNSGIEWLVNLKFATKENVTYFPLRFQYYSIAKDITNLNSSIVNTYGHNNATDFNSTNVVYDVNLFRALLTEVDQIANNRQGFIFSTEKTWNNKFKFGFGMNSSQELENRYNAVTFQQRVNQNAQSSFRFYESYSGPYNRNQYFFMRSFEFIQITDVNVNYRKGFNVMDIDLKYRTKLLERDLIFTNYTNYSTVGDHFSVFVDPTDAAFVRTLYNDFMVYYLLSQKVGINGYFGVQSSLGNNRTELADANGNRITNNIGGAIASPNGKPMNELGYGLGLGVDYHFSDWGGIFLRYCYLNSKDQNFTLNKYSGNEYTFELKVFF